MTSRSMTSRSMTSSSMPSSSKTTSRTVAIIMRPWTHKKIHIRYDGETSFMLEDGLKEIPNNPQTLRGVLLYTGCEKSIIPSNTYYEIFDTPLSDILHNQKLRWKLINLPFV